MSEYTGEIERRQEVESHLRRRLMVAARRKAELIAALQDLLSACDKFAGTAPDLDQLSLGIAVAKAKEVLQ